MLSMTPAVFIPSFSNSVGYDCSLIDHVHPIFCAILRSVELRHYYAYTTFGVLTLYNFCVNRFHSFIFKLVITIVHILMCTGDAGPELSLFLFTVCIIIHILDKLLRF